MDSKKRFSRAILIIMPVPLFVILAISLQLLGLGNSFIFDPPGLLPVLNLFFLFICPIFVCNLAAKGYLESGSVSLITMGSGVFSLAVGSLIAGFLLPSKGPNAVITIHNISVGLSGSLHLIGAMLVFVGVMPVQDARKRKSRLIIIFSSIFAILVILTFGVFENFLPTFFIQGQGPTLLRQIILGIATFSFLVSGFLFIILYKNSRSLFLYWYAAALFLISIGLGCVFIQKSFGGSIGWLGRIAQYTGGLYLIISILSGAKEVGVTITRFDKVLEKFFRNRFEVLLRERTAELKIEIKERMQAEEDVQESEQKYRILIENLPQKINYRNRNSEFVTCNVNFADEFKISPEEVIGKTDFDFYPKELAQKYRIDDKRVMLSGGTEEIVEEHIQDGKKIIVQAVKTAVFDDKGTIVGLLCIYWDITERKQAEDQIKVNLKEKETLLHEVHHRVKNNMQVINSLLKLQSNNIEDVKTKEILKDSQSRVYAMSAVHETLHGSENLSEIDLKSYLTKITTSVFQTYCTDHRKIKLNSSVDNSPISINQAYPLGLTINELISNSLKYAFPNDKKGEISVTMKRLDTELALIVKDDGIGMPGYFDWKNTKSLGLKLVRTLVENQLDGSIDMESTNGTKFIIKFNIET
jgi:PAS domain S-box-containing protein